MVSEHVGFYEYTTIVAYSLHILHILNACVQCHNGFSEPQYTIFAEMKRKNTNLSVHLRFYKYNTIVVYNLHCWTRFWFEIPHVIESLILFFDILGTVKIKPNVLLLKIITIYTKLICHFIQ